MHYHDYFETKVRHDTNEPFVCLKDNPPQELQDLIFKIHMDYFGGVLPNDWIYLIISEAFYELPESGCEDCNDHCPIEADPYYHDLAKWLQEPYAPSYCNSTLEAQEDYRLDVLYRDIYAIIGDAQANAKHVIYEAVNTFLKEQAELRRGE